MTFEVDPEGTVICSWHEWDLSDCIVPSFFEPLEDIEESWTTIVVMGLDSALAARLAGALANWCFEAIKDGAEERHATPFGVVLNDMLAVAHSDGDWAKRVPGIVQYADDHREGHLLLVLNNDPLIQLHNDAEQGK